MLKLIQNSSSPDPFDFDITNSRKRWMSIRMFVCSTLPDMHVELKALQKVFFPSLRSWCKSRKLRLVEWDHQCGLPGDTISEENIKLGLDELDCCYEERTAPFFVNILEEGDELEVKSNHVHGIALQYQYVYGLSESDTNALFDKLSRFKDDSLYLTRKKVGDSAQAVEGSVSSYTLRSGEEGEHNGLQTLGEESVGFDADLSAAILKFFQQKIDQLHPLDLSPMDIMCAQKEAHSDFLDGRSSCVLGRDRLIAQIENYIIDGSKTNAPLLVVGIAGAGKSALMAKCAHNAQVLSDQGKIRMNDEAAVENVRIFYHFVGATPRSTDLASFLQRLTVEMRPDMLETQTSLDSLINLTYSSLESRSVKPIIIFIDAINQMDEDKHQYLKRWIPEKLSPNVRLIISTIERTLSHQTIRSFKSSPAEIVCGPLDLESRKALVTNTLSVHSKTLGNSQMKALLDKSGSQYPLWLTLACEELRVHRSYETLIQRIEDLPDDLISLEESVFERFESEPGGNLMKAFVCLLEVSRHGLLQTELLALLGDEEAMQIPEYVGEPELRSTTVRQETTVENAENIAETRENISRLVQQTYVKTADRKREKVKADVGESKESLPYGNSKILLSARDWGIIYRNLKPLLRPCGDLGEGRLDFYHRSLSKAVRKRYFGGNNGEKEHRYNFWHGILADFFESDDDMDRKAEELPYHLEKLLDNNRLISCLMDWEVFDRMYNEDFSIDLLHSWRQCGGYGVATAVYREQLSILRTSEMPLVEFAVIVEKVYGFLIQAGQYSEALELMEERLLDETERLGERPNEMADIYQNMARCKSEIDKAQQFVDQGQLNDNRLIVEYGRKSLHYREQLSGPDNDYRCALANILIAHHLSNVADLTHEVLPREEAFVAIEEATKVFTQLGDTGHIAECLMTKAIIDYSMPFPQREKLLLESLAMCLKGYGANHLLTTRIYLNTGIAYEMGQDVKTAYDFFLKLRETCFRVFGPGHPKTVRAINTLKEPRYARMEEARGRSVPEMA